MKSATWVSLGSIEQLKQKELQELSVNSTRIALSYVDETFSAVSAFCNHVGGPLGKGRIENGYIVLKQDDVTAIVPAPGGTFNFNLEQYFCIASK